MRAGGGILVVISDGKDRQNCSQKGGGILLYCPPNHEMHAGGN